MSRRARIRVEVARRVNGRQAAVQESRPEGLGPDGRLLPGYRYVKGGAVVKVGQ